MSAEHDFDVDTVLATPRDLVPFVVDALKRVLGNRLCAVLLVGSVVKDEWVPRWSDLDVHIFINDLFSTALDQAQLSELQSALGPLDRSRHQIHALQLKFFDQSGYPQNLAAPVRPTYEVVFGSLPGLDKQQLDHLYRKKAGDDLRAIPVKAARVAAAMVSAVDQELVDANHKLASVLNDALYAAAIVISDDPTEALGLSRTARIELVGARVGNADALRRFLGCARDMELVRTSPERLRAMFAAGWSALVTLTEWASGSRDPGLMGRKVCEMRMARHLTQEGLAAAADTSVRTIQLIEQGRPYKLPEKMRSEALRFEAVAKTLGVALSEMLQFRDDDEIAASAFAHLLPEIRENRLRSRS